MKQRRDNTQLSFNKYIKSLFHFCWLIAALPLPDYLSYPLATNSLSFLYLESRTLYVYIQRGKYFFRRLSGILFLCVILINANRQLMKRISFLIGLLLLSLSCLAQHSYEIALPEKGELNIDVYDALSGKYIKTLSDFGQETPLILFSAN